MSAADAPFWAECLGSAMLAAACMGAGASKASRGCGAGPVAVAVAVGAALAGAAMVTCMSGAHVYAPLTIARWSVGADAGESAVRLMGQALGALLGAAVAMVAALPWMARAGRAELEAVLWPRAAARAPLAALVAVAAAACMASLVMLRLRDGSLPFAVAHPAQAALVAGVGLAASVLAFGAFGAAGDPWQAIWGRALSRMLPMSERPPADWTGVWPWPAGIVAGSLLASWVHGALNG